MPSHVRSMLCCAVLATLGACAAEPPAEAGPAAASPSARFEPAPTPFAPYRQVGSTRGVFEVPIPPKMPLGTGAVPVSGGAVRGSVTTGWRQSF